MFPHIDTAHPRWRDWHWQIANAYEAADFGVETSATFPMRVTPYYASLANPHDKQDPIYRQFCIDSREFLADTYLNDPFGEEAEAALAPGIRQRFPDRILAMMSVGCSTYCRHCTRRNYLEQCQVAALDSLITCIQSRPKVREVLVSGGDPLMLEDERIVGILTRLCTLPQLDAVRLCTRMPAVLPMRITEALAEALGHLERIWVQTQFNHPRELTPEAVHACKLLVTHGVPVSNQSVLLKGINDDPEVMADLCARLQRARVRPYYIFQCDPIAGIEHFRTDLAKASELRAYLLTHLGGLACPRVVADLPHSRHKVDLL